MHYLPPTIAVRPAGELFKLVFTVSNVFGTASSLDGFVGAVAFTLVATICVVARKYGAKLPDFVIKFILFWLNGQFVEVFTQKFHFFLILSNFSVTFSSYDDQENKVTTRSVLSWLRIARIISIEFSCVKHKKICSTFNTLQKLY